jgi:hypothetical protein
MYRVSYTNDKNPAVYIREFETFSDAALFSLQQQFIIEIKHYEFKTNNSQDESYNFG